MTIYDVAAAAAVSPSTVSRVFSRPGRVSARMANHVREVADKLGYHTEIAEPLPPRRDNHLVALAVSDITNPAYFGIIRGAEAAASERVIRSSSSTRRRARIGSGSSSNVSSPSPPAS